MDVVIDLETLGVKADTTILTLGAIKFDPYSSDEPGPGIYLKPEVDRQSELGRSHCGSTLEWWSKQAAAVREEAFDEENRIPLEQMISELNRFLVGANAIWAQGSVFDIGILENLYQQLGHPIPWNFWQIRDSRTLFKLVPEDPRPKDRNQAHNALADCYYQALGIQEVYAYYKISKN
jgi:3' exoribonuclease, RNase T-like